MLVADIVLALQNQDLEHQHLVVALPASHGRIYLRAPQHGQGLSEKLEVDVRG